MTNLLMKSLATGTYSYLKILSSKLKGQLHFPQPSILNQQISNHTNCFNLILTICFLQTNLLSLHNQINIAMKKYHWKNTM